MKSSLLFAVIFAGVCTAFPASAQELREPKAHVIIDVADNWILGSEGEMLTARPKDDTFVLRVVGTNEGVTEEEAAEKRLLGMVDRWVGDVKVDKKAKKIDFNGFVGYEVFGNGKYKGSGHTAHFFTAVLFNKKDPSKGVALVGMGRPDGFSKHHPGIYEALKSLRTY